MHIDSEQIWLVQPAKHMSMVASQAQSTWVRVCTGPVCIASCAMSTVVAECPKCTPVTAHAASVTVSALSECAWQAPLTVLQCHATTLQLHAVA